ncbi:MAG TPA: hypothetical protein H9720_06340 [Candidatus Limosilactobacillus intestinigallinarum]|nr:hypothetical protein [Candidatus Limosilactobacillus intestinigallinarum]
MTKINLDINGQQLLAELNDSSAAQALLKKLPLTKKLSDVDGYIEKVAVLDNQLPTDQMANPETLHAGELAYWEAADGTSQTLVLYAGKTDTWPNTFVIGRIIDGDYQSLLVPKNDSLTVKVTKA